MNQPHKAFKVQILLVPRKGTNKILRRSKYGEIVKWKIMRKKFTDRGNTFVKHNVNSWLWGKIGGLFKVTAP